MVSTSDVPILTPCAVAPDLSAWLNRVELELNALTKAVRLVLVLLFRSVRSVLRISPDSLVNSVRSPPMPETSRPFSSASVFGANTSSSVASRP